MSIEVKTETVFRGGMLFRGTSDRSGKTVEVDFAKEGQPIAGFTPLELLLTSLCGCSGQVVVSTFASHLHRIQSLCGIAARSGRQPVPMGLRMTRTLRHGIDRGLFDAPAGLLRDRDELPQIPERRRLVIAGGCQGERDSSLNRISLDNEPRLTLGHGDLVVISASIIPGCDVNVGRMADRFLRRGVSVVHAAELRDLHVSGHAGREEIREVLALLRPEAAIPIHGDRTHLEAAARLAEEAGDESLGDETAAEPVATPLRDAESLQPPPFGRPERHRRRVRPGREARKPLPADRHSDTWPSSATVR